MTKTIEITTFQQALSFLPKEEFDLFLANKGSYSPKSFCNHVTYCLLQSNVNLKPDQIEFKAIFDDSWFKQPNETLEQIWAIGQSTSENEEGCNVVRTKYLKDKMLKVFEKAALEGSFTSKEYEQYKAFRVSMKVQKEAVGTLKVPSPSMVDLFMSVLNPDSE